jgi:hypothetical protein
MIEIYICIYVEHNLILYVQVEIQGFSKISKNEFVV